MRMPDVTVTADAGNFIHLLRPVRNCNVFGNVRVTITARFFGHALVAPRNLNRLVETAERKIIRMPETVCSLCVVFSHEIVGRVTIVAGSNGMMTRFLPAVVLLVHNMAVSARSWIITQVRITFGINERIKANSQRQTNGNANDYQF